jgi:hypothetical protein
MVSKEKKERQSSLFISQNLTLPALDRVLGLNQGVTHLIK